MSPVSLSLLCLFFSLSCLSALSDPIYQLALDLYHNRTHKHNITLSQVHLIRVPKASSSSVSMLARRLAGCNPPGPCCRWPGEPPGSCPAKGLYECAANQRVIGCIHHFPNYGYLLNKDVFSMTMLRDPVSRAMSAYNYSTIHYNSHCHPKGSHSCVYNYVHSNAFSNIAVKLFSGHYSYTDMPTCRYKKDCKASLEQAIENIPHFDFLGISELWQISLLLYHQRLKHLPPLSYEFAAGSEGAGESGIKGLRVTHRNSSSIFAPFMNDLYNRNKLDIELYHASIDRLCKDLHTSGLWKFKIVQENWWTHTRHNVTLCMPEA
jgi:hypothetical protein